MSFGTAGTALLLAQHARLRKATGRALADQRRWVAAEDLEQRMNGLIGCQVRQTLNGPVADVHVLVV